MIHKSTPRELDDGGYDLSPQESEVVGMRLVDGVYVPSRVVDPLGFEWATVDVGWLPTGRYVPKKATHEWGAVTYERD